MVQTPSMSPDSREGTALGPYQIERLLGRGGMGVVYLALDPRLERRVALKVLAPELTTDMAFRERFVREARMAAAADHPNIIPIYEAGEADGVYYLAMRYVDGTDLETVLDQQHVLSPQQAVGVLGQVAAALDAAHERGLVHRDVKPGNVMLASGRGAESWGHVYLTDFGLTKRTAGQTRLTATGAFIGTIAYVAPEQVQGQDVDGRTDQYSLACMTYECLTGEEPFRRSTDVASLMAHLSDPPPSASEKGQGIPAAVDPVIARGMAKAAADRYADCSEFVAAVADALGEVTTGPSVTSSPTGPSLIPPMMPAPSEPVAEPTPTPPPASAVGPTVLSQPPTAPPPAPPAQAPAPAPATGQPPTPFAPPEAPAQWPGQEPERRGGRRHLPLIAAAVVVLAGIGVGAALLLGGGGDGGGGGKAKGTTAPPTVAGATCQGIPTVKQVSAGGEDIFLMKADGSDQTRVIGHGGGVAFFPDCRQVAFASGLGDTTQVFAANLDGSKRHPITQASGNSSQVDVSPDGKQIVFAGERGGPRDLFVEDVDGTGERRLPTDGDLGEEAADLFPVWSPDGTQIAYTSNRDGDMDVWIIDADGSKPPTHVVNDPGQALEAAWSPDGKRIAYSSTLGQKGGSHEIFVVEVASGQITRATRDTFNDVQPDWLDDATLIFATNRAGNYDIFEVAADGSAKPSPVTRDPIDEKKPDVSPDGTLIAYSAGASLSA
jgi:serine/threonine protein kinase/Tol biopolymer transport system component